MALSPGDRDLMIRTALGEAEDGSDADVADIARGINDHVNNGRSVPDVIFEKGRYPSWDKDARKLLGRRTDSKAYQRVAEIVDKATASDAPAPGSVLGLFGVKPDGPAPAAAAPGASSSDDLAPGSILKLFGHDVDTSGKMPPTQAAPGQGPGPEILKAAEDLARRRGPVQPLVHNTPIVGPGIEAAGSAGAAALAPLFTNVGNKDFAERFRDYQAITEAANDIYAKKYPGAELAGGIVGTAATLGPFAATGPGALVMGMRGPTLGARVYSGMAGGAGINAIDALMRGESPQTSGLFGAAAGAGGPLLSETVRAGVNMFGRPVPALRGYNSVVRNALTGALEGETPASLNEGVRRMGPAGFLGDLNAGMTDITGAVADTPGPGKQVVREAYRQRAAAARDRIEGSITTAMGPPTDIVKYDRFLTEARKAAADPLYESFRTTQVQPTPELRALIPRLKAAGVFDAASEIGGVSGRPMDVESFVALNQSVGPGGVKVGATPKSFPTAENWDLIKRGIDRRIDQAYGANDASLARELVKLKHEVISGVGKTNAGPIWNQARAEFADRAELQEQIKRGYDTFFGTRGERSVDYLRDELSSLEGPERAARLQGVRNAVRDAMDASIHGDSQMRDKLLAPGSQQKLRMYLGDEAADQLINDLRSERYLAQQDTNVRGGSQTTPKKERVQMLQPPPLPQWNPNVTAPLTWIPPHILDELRPTTIIEGARGQRHGNALADLSRLVTTHGESDIRDLVRAITDEQARRAATEATAQRAGRAAGVLPLAATSVLRARRPQMPALVSPAQ